MKTLKYQTYELKYKDFPLEYDLIKNVDAQPHDYSKDYLTFKALEDGTFHFTMPIYYSLDNGKTWLYLTSESNYTTPMIAAGETVMFKNSATKGGTFSSSGKYEALGNPYSLIYGDNFSEIIDLNGNSEILANLFKESSELVSAKNLSLPATTLSASCYSGMFWDCTSLVDAPALPATTLSNNCYYRMFKSCSCLAAAPELPATTLTNYCYYEMFAHCGLDTAPELPATTLAQSCYGQMFTSCTSLNYIKAMFTTTPSTAYTTNWVNGVAPTGTFVKNSAATWDVTGDNGIPTGWTVETADVTN